MAITFENALGVMPDTLQYRTQRTEVLASNIANVDTPGFKAKDLNFSTMLGQQKAMLTLDKSNQNHLTLPGNPEVAGAIEQREIRQPSADGNTVDLGQEQAAFMRNRMDYEVSFTFLNMRFKGLEKAIAGQ